MATDEAPVYEFGNFRLEVRERRLLRDGHPIPLTTKVFETLRVLLERSGRLLTKDELMQHDLARHGRRGEQPQSQHLGPAPCAGRAARPAERFIETVPRVGYRFVADVTQSAPRPARSRPRRPPRPRGRCARRSASARRATARASPIRPSGRARPWPRRRIGSATSNTSGTAPSGGTGSARSRSGTSSCAGTSGGADSRTGTWRTFRSTRGCATRRPWWMPWDSSALRSWVSRRAARWLPPMRRGIPSASAISCCAAPTRRGWRHRGDASEIEARTALLNLTRLGWGQNNPAFRQLFTTRFIPDAGAAEMEWFNDLQRVSTSPENAARLMDSFSRLDVRPAARGHHGAHDRLPLPARRRRAVRGGATPGCRHPRDRRSSRCPAAITSCSNANPHGRSSCESLERFSVGQTLRPQKISHSHPESRRYWRTLPPVTKRL